MNSRARKLLALLLLISSNAGSFINGMQKVVTAKEMTKEMVIEGN